MTRGDDHDRFAHRPPELTPLDERDHRRDEPLPARRFRPDALIAQAGWQLSGLTTCAGLPSPRSRLGGTVWPPDFTPPEHRRVGFPADAVYPDLRNFPDVIAIYERDGGASLPAGLRHALENLFGDQLEPLRRARGFRGELRRAAPLFGLRVEDVTLSFDNGALLRGRGARGVTTGTTIALDAGRLEPTTAEGRYVLGHELAHVAQRRVRGDHDDVLAEGEAAAIGRAFARGAAFDLPSAPLVAEAAADTDAEDLTRKALANPPRVQIAIKPDGLQIVPRKGARYVPGVQKGPQVVAAVIKALVKTGFSSDLVLDVLEACGASSFEFFPEYKEEAEQRELVVETFAPMPLVRLLLEVLEQREVELRLSSEERLSLARSIGLWQAWPTASAYLPEWYTEGIFLRVGAQHGLLADAFTKAFAAYEAEKTDATATTAILAARAIAEALAPYALALDAIRADPELTNEPGYRRSGSSAPRSRPESRWIPRSAPPVAPTKPWRPTSSFAATRGTSSSPRR